MSARELREKSVCHYKKAMHPVLFFNCQCGKTKSLNYSKSKNLVDRILGMNEVGVKLSFFLCLWSMYNLKTICLLPPPVSSSSPLPYKPGLTRRRPDWAWRRPGRTEGGRDGSLTPVYLFVLRNECVLLLQYFFSDVFLTTSFLYAVFYTYLVHELLQSTFR